MGLAFLNKKSWHTASFQNIERVWLAEQKQREALRKQGENTKKLKEERHIEDIKRMQVNAGLIPASHLNRLDWIYEGGNKVQQKNTEEYLMGKPVTEKELQGGNQNKEKGSNPHMVPLYKEEIGNAKNEAFTKLHEDPLYLIMQEEMRTKREVLANPVKMKNIAESY